MDEVDKRARLGVVSRQQLVVEAVRFLFRAARRRAHGIVWQPGEALHPADVAQFDVAVLVDDLDSAPVVNAVGHLLASTPRPWVVVTAHPPGPVWGALLARGRVLVCDARSDVGEVVEMADELADPDRDLPGHAERVRLIGEWNEWNAAATVFRTRLATLTPRERTVLERLDQGLSASEIAEQLGVTTGTIRTQVKSLRRKLGVDSQLAAVAALHRYAGDSTASGLGPALPRPRRGGDEQAESALDEQAEPAQGEPRGPALDPRTPVVGPGPAQPGG